MISPTYTDETDAPGVREQIEALRNDLDIALEYIRVIGEETVIAGYPAGDRKVTLANIRAMRDAIKDAPGAREQIVPRSVLESCAAILSDVIAGRAESVHPFTRDRYVELLADLRARLVVPLDVKD